MNAIKDSILRINEYITDSDITSIEQFEDRTVISIDLRTSPIYDEYSGKNFLSPDIFEYLENVFRFIGNKTVPLHIHFIYPEGMSDQEKEHIKNLYRIHYAIAYREEKKSIKYSNIEGVIFLIIGIILLSVDYFVNKKNIGAIISDVVLIFSWVFIWEACSKFTLANFESRLQISKDTILFTANIE